MIGLRSAEIDILVDLSTSTVFRVDVVTAVVHATETRVQVEMTVLSRGDTVLWPCDTVSTITLQLKIQDRIASRNGTPYPSISCYSRSLSHRWVYACARWEKMISSNSGSVLVEE